MQQAPSPDDGLRFWLRGARGPSQASWPPLSVLIGREKELREMAERLIPGKPAYNKVLFVCGPLGIGKTSLVRHYCEEHLDAYASNVYWFTAQSDEDLNEKCYEELRYLSNYDLRYNAYLAASNRMGAARDFMSRDSQGKRLVVLDGAENLSYAIRSELATINSGSIIMISRSTIDLPTGQNLLLGHISPSSSVRLLADECYQKDMSKSDLETIASLLQHHPGCLTWATQVLNKFCSPADYINQFRVGKPILHEGTQKQIKAILNMVGLGDPNSPARVFLNQCALLSSTSVPWALFQETERAISKTQLVSGWEELGNVIWRLEKHGLARLDIPEKRFVIEAPLQKFLISTNDQINRDTLMMASLLARSDLSTHSDMLLPHFNALKRRFGDLMERHEQSHKPFFDWLFYFGSFFKLQRTSSADSDAIIFYELALKHWRMLQLSGRSLVDLLNNLGLVYHRTGDSSKASKCFGEAFELLARDEPSDLEALIKLKCNAVSVLKISDPLQDGLRELENLKKSAEEQGNISSSVMVNLYFVMGTTELRCGEVKVARRFLEKANELWNSTHDSADDTAFEIAHNIGQAYAEQGSYFKAIEWHKDTLENRIAHFGEDHYDTQKSRASLGNAYALKKEWGKAQKEFETAIAWQVKNLGGHNIDTLKTRQDYGCRLGEQGEFDEAKSVLESVYEDRRKYYRNTWDCANVAADLAILFRDARMESEARHYFKEADEWYDRNPSNEPQHHDYRYKNKYLYAELIRFTNKQKARKLLEEARDNLAGRKRSTVWYKLACERLDELTKADTTTSERLPGHNGSPNHIEEGQSQEKEGGFDIRLSAGTEKGAIFGQPRTFNELNKTWDRCFQFHVRDTRVKIAVLDTGIDLEHEDFRAARATSFIGGRPKSAPGEDSQIDRIKEKRNFCGNEDCVQDYDGHGTQVAGIILRLAPRADIYIARVCDGNVQESEDDRGKRYISKPSPKAVKEAILWAIEKKVDIINMSFGFNAEVPEINEALNSARENRTLIFAAMRNDGIFEKAAWPARELQDSIGIHSCIEEGKRSSVFTPKCVAANPNLMTVGENIPTHQLTAKGGGFRVSTGTSFATPVAVAMAALILAFVNQTRCKAERNNLGIEKLEMMRENYWMARILKHVSDESDDNYSWINPALLWITESGDDVRDKLSHDELKRHAWSVLDAALKK